MCFGFADYGGVVGMIGHPLHERSQPFQLLRPRLALRSLFLGVGHGPKAEGLSPHLYGLSDSASRAAALVMLWASRRAVRAA